MNARLGIKTHSLNSASRQSAHILRHGKKADIVIFAEPTESSFTKNEHIISADERAKLRREIGTYQKRADKYKAEGKDRLAEKALLTVAEKKALLDGTNGAKRKDGVELIELELCITDGKADIKSDEFIKYAKTFFADKFPDLELVTGALHNDQKSTHVHILAKIPENKTWNNIIGQHGNFRERYSKLTQEWHNHIAQSGIKLEPLVGGKKYLDLPKYKWAVADARKQVIKEINVAQKKRQIEVPEVPLPIRLLEKIPKLNFEFEYAKKAEQQIAQMGKAVALQEESTKLAQENLNQQMHQMLQRELEKKKEFEAKEAKLKEQEKELRQKKLEVELAMSRTPDGKLENKIVMLEMTNANLKHDLKQAQEEVKTYKDTTQTLQSKNKALSVELEQERTITEKLNNQIGNIAYNMVHGLKLDAALMKLAPQLAKWIDYYHDQKIKAEQTISRGGGIIR